MSAEEVECFELDVLAEFVLARSAAGLSDLTIRSDVGNIDASREWFGAPLWEMTPEDADRYFGTELRSRPNGTRLARAQALVTYFEFLELRHNIEIHNLIGRSVSCPIDQVNRPRGSKDARLRIPPRPQEMQSFFTDWAAELASCRKFASVARNYAAARLMADVGLRVNEARNLDLADIKWDLGTFGKLHVRMGKGARGSGPKERMVPLLNGAGKTLRWYVQDVWGHFDDDHLRPGAPLFLSERTNTDGTHSRVGYDTLRRGLADATTTHLPEWVGRMSPHVLRHYCASSLYGGGMDLIAIQEMLGHRWISTTMGYVHVQRNHIEQAWLAGLERVGKQLKGLV